MPNQPLHRSPSTPDSSIRSAVIGFFPRRLRHWAGAGAVFALIAGVTAIAVVLSGIADLSATSPHPVGWAELLHATFQRSTAAHAEKVPANIRLDDPALVMAGAAHYANVCATCHGAPGLGQNPVALSMRPEPPMLLEAADRYTEGELFRIVSGGVRYSAMPAWPVSNRPDEVWALVAFLKAMPGMDPAQYQRLAHDVDLPGTTRPKAQPPASESKAQTSTAAAGTADTGRASRPYLPGDPQSLFASSHATDRPATGFVTVHSHEGIAASCGACHGADGAGRKGGIFPNLTLQDPDYISATLRAFASGDRQSGIMWPVAANLSDEDIASLAEAFGEAVPKPSPGPEPATDPEQIARGRDIALNGIPLSGASGIKAPGEPVPMSVQACQGCHGGGLGREPAVPNIAGQNAAYLQNQLRLFRGNGRGYALPDHAMSIVSHRLEDPDIEALAAYYASLQPEKTAGPGESGVAARGMN